MLETFMTGREKKGILVLWEAALVSSAVQAEHSVDSVL